MALLLSVLLVISGDWGVSDASLLEDFCWNVNFGHHSLLDGKIKSNWPALQWVVYLTTAVFYFFSFFFAIFAKLKINPNNGLATLFGALRNLQPQTPKNGCRSGS